MKSVETVKLHSSTKNYSGIFQLLCQKRSGKIFVIKYKKEKDVFWRNKSYFSYFSNRSSHYGNKKTRCQFSELLKMLFFLGMKTDSEIYH